MSSSSSLQQFRNRRAERLGNAFKDTLGRSPFEMLLVLSDIALHYLAALARAQSQRDAPQCQAAQALARSSGGDASAEQQSAGGAQFRGAFRRSERRKRGRPLCEHGGFDSVGRLPLVRPWTPAEILEVIAQIAQRTGKQPEGLRLAAVIHLMMLSEFGGAEAKRCSTLEALHRRAACSLTPPNWIKSCAMRRTCGGS
jgi:hypothetical protein